ncbi:MAG: ABC transporter permease [Alphaproteobacteria bacterium]|nr:ABC transporter permease [Alphaproteobacteria bacterium]
MADSAGVPIAPWRRLWLYALGVAIVLFLVLPTVIVVPMSFGNARFLRFPPQELSLRWYHAYLGSIEWRDATWISLKAAVATMLVATPLGVMAAYGLHASRLRMARLIETALIAPLILPLILVSIAIFFLYARLGLNNTVTGLVLAHCCLAMPFVFVTVLAALKGYDMNQERVARSLGASRFVAFITITLPQIRFSVFSGALLAFITSLDETVVALFISGGDAATLTRRMFTALRDEIDPTVAAISSLLIGVTLTLLALGLVFGDRRRAGRQP